MRDANDYSKANLLVELTSNIVVAYLGNHIVPIADVAHLISNVHSTLSDVSRHMQVVETIEKQKPAVAVRKSVQSNHITCLECGENFKSLKRHLTTFHSLSPDEYREKWELPAEYPMVAPTYAEARSQLAKEMGLGQRRSRS